MRWRWPPASRKKWPLTMGATNSIWWRRSCTSFCSEDLGGFYLDILKDRLYTAGTDSHARRSAQNALHHLTHSLLRLLAPILSFTAEEAWAAMTGKADDSVFLHTWHSFPPVSGATELLAKWQAIRELRARVTKELETVRVSGAIGSSLQAEVEIQVGGELFELLQTLGDDLRFVLITSQARSRQKARRKKSPSTPAPSRNASAAGTTAPKSARMPSTRPCADAAFPTCSAPGKHAPMRDWRLWLLGSAVVIALDLLTKQWVVQAFSYGDSLPLTSFFNLVRAHNSGAAFSFLAEAGGWQRLFFIAVASIASAVIIYLLRKHHRETLFSLSLSLVLGGALGNLIDRIRWGYVVDFLDFFYGTYHWPAFNVADMAITGGVMLLILDSLRKPGGKKT